jgi:cob(I)alamin adenosyltransferase
MPKVYTRYGDSGETSLLYGGRVKKNDLRTEAYGTIDEAVSALGMARISSTDPQVKEIILNLQKDLFTAGAELATDKDHFNKFLKHFSPITEDMIKSAEETIDELQSEFELPPFFVLPGGSSASSAIDLSRSILRRAERWIVSLDEGNLIREESVVLPYINRVADLLFILARYEDRKLENDLLK